MTSEDEYADQVRKAEDAMNAHGMKWAGKLLDVVADDVWQAEMAKLSETTVHDGRGKINVWVCDSCRKNHICRDVDHGVTPFVIRCWGPGCKGEAVSQFYQAGDQVGPRGGPLEAQFEWFRPSSLQVVPESYRDHLQHGGLVMRRVGQTELSVTNMLEAHQAVADDRLAAYVDKKS